jgi:hypothetical protein
MSAEATTPRRFARVPSRRPPTGAGAFSRPAGPSAGARVFSLLPLPALVDLQALWGTTWIDHLRLLLPLGIVLLLLLRFVLSYRRRYDAQGPVVLYAPVQPTPPSAAEPAPSSVAPFGPPSEPEPTPRETERPWHAEPRRHPEPARLPEFAWHADPAREAEPIREAEHPRPPEPTRRTDFLRQPEFSPPPRAAAPRSSAEDSPTIRIVLSEGSPIEFLPGRLEIVEGLPSDQEFRFQRVSGGDAPEVTLGRSSGPSYRHIQLAAPTVSRIHARMRFEGDRWVIRNLSEANPLCVQGRPLTGPHVLVDGDEVQVGEVLLRYRDGRR